MGLGEFLLDVQRVLKALPAAWVRCDLHKVAVRGGATELELVEADAASWKITAKARAVFWPGRWRRTAETFAAHGLVLEAGDRVLIHIRGRLQPLFGFDLEAGEVDLTFALGDLAGRVRAIRERLRAEGHYDR